MLNLPRDWQKTENISLSLFLAHTHKHKHTHVAYNQRADGGDHGILNLEPKLDSLSHTHTQVKRIINEPTAAALAFGVIDTNTGGGSRNLLVFDFGGGTLDVTIMQVLHAQGRGCVNMQ